MDWTLIIVGVLIVWASLTVIGGERERRRAELTRRLRAQMQAADAPAAGAKTPGRGGASIPSLKKAA